MYIAVLLTLAFVASGAPAAASQVNPDTVGTDPAGAITVTDDAGRLVALSAPARRVFSVLPSVTETVAALDSRRLIARTRYDRDPELAHLPSLGGGFHPNLEALARLKPDLVVAWADPGRRSTAERVEAFGIPVYRADPQTIADLRRHFRRIGALLGLGDRAEALVSALDRDLAEVAAAVRGRDRVAVYYSVWHDPPQTTGSGTFIGEIIEFAGGRNVFGDAAHPWPRVSLEAIVRRDPDVLVTASGSGESGDLPWLRGPGWRELRAVRTGRYLVVDGDLFNRPGPRVAEAARRLARFLHGDDLPLPGGVSPAVSAPKTGVSTPAVRDPAAN